MAGTAEIRKEIVERHLGQGGSLSGQRHSSERLVGRTLLVTGGNSGVGEAVAERVAIAGANVLITGRNQDRIDQTIGNLRALGVRAHGVQGDMTDPQTVEKVVGKLERYFDGKVHGIFSNAGAPIDKKISMMSEGEFMEPINVMVLGAFRLIRATQPHLLKAAGEDGYASVVFNSSVSAEIGTGGQANYVAAKLASEGLGLVLAAEVGGDGVNSNSVRIGPADTGVWERPSRVMISGYRREYGRRETLDDPLVAIKNKMPLAGNDLMPVEKVAGNIAHLFTRDATMITGQSILIDAGFTRPSDDEVILLTRAYVERARLAAEQASAGKS